MSGESKYIGESLLEMMEDRCGSSFQNAPLPSTSIIHSLLAAFMDFRSSDDTPHHARILLEGSPVATSLAMDTACAIASHCSCRLVPCQCVAVTFLTRQGVETSFPLPCHAHTNTRWNPQILKRIQIIRLPDARSLISYLLNLHRKDTQQQQQQQQDATGKQKPQPQLQPPWGAIIVDGIDHFVKNNADDSVSNVNSEQSFRMVQICTWTCMFVPCWLCKLFLHIGFNLFVRVAFKWPC